MSKTNRGGGKQISTSEAEEATEEIAAAFAALQTDIENGYVQPRTHQRAICALRVGKILLNNIDHD
jgi:seryl-tRNA(Sec) selenium transferase